MESVSGLGTIDFGCVPPAAGLLVLRQVPRDVLRNLVDHGTAQQPLNGGSYDDVFEALNVYRDVSRAKRVGVVCGIREWFNVIFGIRYWGAGGGH
jgi:hypothetical protein